MDVFLKRQALHGDTTKQNAAEGKKTNNSETSREKGDAMKSMANQPAFVQEIMSELYPTEENNDKSLTGEDDNVASMSKPPSPQKMLESTISALVPWVESELSESRSGKIIEKKLGTITDAAKVSMNEKDNLLTLTIFVGDKKPNELSRLVEQNTKKRTKGKKLCSCTPFALALSSNLLFVIGSIFYLWLSLEDYEWALEASNAVPFNRRLAIPNWNLHTSTTTQETDYINIHDELRGKRLLKKKDYDKSGSEYDEYWWGDLPHEAQEYAKILGYNEHLWDEDMRAATDSLHWAELNRMEKEAAVFFGYDQQSWDAEESDLSHESYSDSNERIAERFYGGHLWNNNYADTTEVQGSTGLEENKGRVSGLESESENGESFVLNSGAKGDDAKSYFDVEWHQLPFELQRAAHTLGYTGQIWNSDGASETDELYWKDLTKAQKDAAATFGYDKRTWDNESNFHIEYGDYEKENYKGDDDIFNNDEEDWDGVYWSDLPKDIRSAAKTLGYNKHIWDYNGTAYTDGMHWAELTHEQQEAAHVFGYDRNSWDVVYGDVPSTKEITQSAPQTDEDNEILASNNSISDATHTDEEDSSGSTYKDDQSTANHEDWDEYYWTDLPQEIRIAATILGYNKDIWNNNGTTFADNLQWEELTSEQQHAAAIFGYNQKMWDGVLHETDTPEVLDENDEPVQGFTDGVIETQLTSSKPNSNEKVEEEISPSQNIVGEEGEEGEEAEEEKESATKVEHDAGDYNQYAWSELPQRIRDAAMVLGYNQEIWNSNSTSYTDELYWVELTEEQQEAATLFGYNQAEWDGIFYNNTAWENELLPGSNDGEENWLDSTWSELPEIMKTAAAVLGYDKNSWDAGDSAYTDQLYWSQLSQEQQQAASLFGYDQAKWDGVEDTTHHTKSNAEDKTPFEDSSSNDDTSDYSYHGIVWDDYYWSELPKTIQDAALILGYDQHIWDNGIMSYTDNLYWAQLTTEQKQAAMIMGYDQEKWDMDDEYSTEGIFGIADDDYVIFYVGESIVSTYAVIYSVAAICFIGTGVLDFLREKQIFHIFMVLAGTFGFVAAIIVDMDEYISNIFNCISVHFFLLEAFNVFRRNIKRGVHKKLSPMVGSTAWAADVFFTIGAFLEVILSYLYLSPRYNWNTTVALFSILTAIFFAFCSSMYTFITIALRVERKINTADNDKSSNEAPPADVLDVSISSEVKVSYSSEKSRSESTVTSSSDNSLSETSFQTPEIGGDII